jgi:hypothetical protein
MMKLKVKARHTFAKFMSVIPGKKDTQHLTDFTLYLIFKEKERFNVAILVMLWGKMPGREQMN